MSSISQVLRHDVVLADVLANLRQGRVPRLLLQGASGTGKSYLAGQMQAAWEANRLPVIHLRGDIGRTQEPYYPLTGLLRTRSWRTETRRWFEAAAEDAPVGRSLLKRVVDLIPADTTPEPGRQLALPQDPAAIEAFTLIRRRTEKAETLLILDDIHLYDAKTLALLKAVILNPFVLGEGTHRLSVLATENTDEPNRSTLYLSFIAAFRPVTLNYCSRGEFRALLAAAGWQWELPDDLTDRLYTYSHGHLRAVHELVSHFRDRPLGAIGVGEDAGLLKMLLHLRLAERHADGEVVREVFSQAAVMGSSFSKVELECMIANDEPMAHALRAAAAMQIVHDDGLIVRFQHGSIHHFFLELAEQQHREFHLRYADCLREIRPSDYAARAYHLRLGANPFSAAIAGIQSRLSAYRAGNLSREPGETETAFPDLDVYAEAMREAYVHHCRGEYRSSFAAASAIHDAYPEILIAERDYLAAEALLHEIGNDAATTALEMASAAVRSAEREGELYCRLLYLVHMAEAQLGHYAKSRATQKVLMQYLAERRLTDPGLNRLLIRAQLASDSVEHLETAGYRIQTALAQMERQQHLIGVMNPLDHYVAQTNFAANRIVAGVYDQAQRAAAQALRLVAEHPPIELPAPWSAWNNYFLSTYLDGTTSLAETMAGFQQLLDRMPLANDDMLIRINVANFHARAGEYDAALKILERHSEEFYVQGDCDEYYVYYSEHCRCAVLFLTGRRDEALDLWEAIGNLIPPLQPGVRDFLQHRHAELQRWMRTTQTATPDEWDAALEGARDHRGGPWRYFKRGFLLTDIQVWYRF